MTSSLWSQLEFYENQTKEYAPWTKKNETQCFIRHFFLLLAEYGYVDLTTLFPGLDIEYIVSSFTLIFYIFLSTGIWLNRNCSKKERIYFPYVLSCHETGLYVCACVNKCMHICTCECVTHSSMVFILYSQSTYYLPQKRQSLYFPRPGPY